MTEDVLHNQVWIDGVELKNIVSGDVSYVEGAVSQALENNESGWIRFEFEGGHYNVWVTPATSIIVRYVG